MSPNRVVAVATPLVFAPLAGALSAWLAEHFPGFNVQQSSLEEIFIAGALIALAPAAQWLHGWQKFEARQADLLPVDAPEAAPTADGDERDLDEWPEADEPSGVLREEDAGQTVPR